MDTLLTYRGRAIGPVELQSIRAVQAAHPGASRRALSQRVCEAWDWRQPNGALRDMLCRSLLLALERAGHITLPPVRGRPPNNVIARPRPAPAAVSTTQLAAPLAALLPLELAMVRRTPREALYDQLIAQHHYLGPAHGVGEQLKYLAFAGERPIAALGFTSAPRHLAPRDRFIGWSPVARRAHVHELAYQTRFLILPGVRVPHLASHLLGQMARIVPADWERRYGHPVVFLETFVDPARSRGTCYRAANWVVLGETTGRGKDDHTNRPTRSRKTILGYPLTPRFRGLLGADP